MARSGLTPLVLPASLAGTTTGSLQVPHGTAPSSPANGAVWTTTAGMFVRVNGSTVGPLGTSSADMVLATQQTVTGRKTFVEATGGPSLTVRTAAAGSTQIMSITDNAGTTQIMQVNPSFTNIGHGGTTSALFTFTTTLDNPSLVLRAGDSSASPTTRDSPVLSLYSTYWNGSTSVSESVVFEMRRTGASANAHYLQATGSTLLLAPQSADFTTLRLLRGTDTTPAANIFTVETRAAAVLAAFNALGKLVAVTGGTDTASINLPPGVAPSSPVNGDVWTTTTGVFARINGVTIGPLGEPIEPYVFGYPGAIAITTGLSTIYMDASYTLVSARGYLTTAPTGASAIIVVKKNGATVNTITIAAGTNTAVSNVATTFVAGDIMTVDITQVGSSVTGSDLTTTVRLRRTS